MCTHACCCSSSCTPTLPQQPTTAAATVLTSSSTHSTHDQQTNICRGYELPPVSPGGWPVGQSWVWLCNMMPTVTTKASAHHLQQPMHCTPTAPDHTPPALTLTALICTLSATQQGQLAHISYCMISIGVLVIMTPCLDEIRSVHVR